MGRASPDRLGTGPSTGPGQAPSRPRERHGDLNSDARRPAAPCSPFSARSDIAARLGRAWRAAVCALAVAAPVLLSGAAGAQTPAKLVGNTGQADHPTVRFTTFQNDMAQAFSTGPHDGVYRLTGVDLNLSVPGGTPPGLSFSICSDQTKRRSASLVTLTKPASLSTGTNSYAVPGGGIELVR